MSTATITVEQVEQLAAHLTVDNETTRAKLRRLIKAYARILALREPGLFKRRATIYADQDGHYDNSYPPSQEWKRRTGPLAYKVRAVEFDSRATTGGFYHDSEYFTTDGGLYISPTGELLEAELTGTGSYGQFAAYPGACNVDCTIEYRTISNPTLTDLQEAEEELRALAFPASTEAE